MTLKTFTRILVVVTIGVALAFLLFKNQNQVNTNLMPAPTKGKTEIFAGQLEGEGSDAKERWHEMIHRAAPGTDWEAIDNQTRQKILEKRNGLNVATRTSETFGNGNLTGEWIELGSNNNAGNLETLAYDKAANKIYGVSGGGTIWQANLDGTAWTPLNEDIQFRTGILNVVEDGGGTKYIVAAIGKDLHYSSDNGVTWTASNMDIASVDNWGEPTEMVALDDGTIYYMRRAWDPSPWAPRMWVYRSTDFGVNFSRIAVYDPVGSNSVNSRHTQMWLPLGGTTVFILHQGKELYTINGTTSTLRSTNTDLTQEVWLDLEGNITGTDTTLYALMEKTNVYKSTDMGATWTMQGSTPVNTWNVGFSVSPFDATKMYMGAVECYRSYDSGATWTKVNTWQSYYSDNNKIHADIMDIESYEKTDGTQFTLVANHGGLHASYDDLMTTTNAGAAGLNIGQFYDVRTDPLNPNYVYGGTQDQGHQRTSVASGATGPIDFTQVISGDYGHTSFSRNDQSLWTVYPFGWVTYYHNPQTSSISASYTVEGTDPPVSDWIYPTSETVDPADNSIYVAGGDINNGPGSHLVTLTANASGNSISATQFSYDFMANSNNGSSAISAIEPSYVDADRLYVATDDGTFFYSNDGGSTWNKTAGFTGPGEYWLYGATIFASRSTSNLVYFGGSGYSNDPVWKSTDGGVTFTSMSNGLPSLLVHEIVANDTETLLFAATDVGPYVYVVADNMWYSMMGTIAPLQRYYSVEYVDSDQLIRFGTYGRGIWDFKILSQPLPVELIAFDVQLIDNQSVKIGWSTASETNNDYFEIERSTNGVDFEVIDRVPSKGNGVTQHDYQITDPRPQLGINYYRLKQVDFNDKFEYSATKSIEVKDEFPTITIYPNPVRKGDQIMVDNANVNMLLQVFDTNGRLVKEELLESNASISTEGFLGGSYFYQIRNTKSNESIQSGKLIVF